MSQQPQPYASLRTRVLPQLQKLQWPVAAEQKELQKGEPQITEVASGNNASLSSLDHMRVTQENELPWICFESYSGGTVTEMGPHSEPLQKAGRQRNRWRRGGWAAAHQRDAAPSWALGEAPGHRDQRKAPQGKGLVLKISMGIWEHRARYKGSRTRVRSVVQLCPTLCNPMDYGPPVSPAQEISQARTLERVAISCSRGSSQRRDRTCVSCIGRWILDHLGQLGSPPGQVWPS